MRGSLLVRNGRKLGFPGRSVNFRMVEINVCERRLADHTLPSLYPAPFRGVCRVSESKVAIPAESTRQPVRAVARAALLLPVPKTWWQRRPKAYRHPLAAVQNRKFSLLAILFVVLLHLYFLYELTRPVIPRFALPVEILDDEPVEVEIDLTEPSAAPAPPESTAEQDAAASAEAAQEVQTSAPPSNPVPTPTPPSEPTSSTASVAQAATPVLASEQSAPAPQPLLSVDPVVVASATELPIVIDETEAAEAVTELPDEQAGALGGNLPESEDRVAAVRPLAAQAVVAPERIAAAPITLLPSINPPSVQQVPSAKAVLRPSTEPAPRPDLAVETPQPSLPEALPPAPVVSVTQPLRVQPEVMRPPLDIERSKPELATVGVPSAAAVPVQRVQRVVTPSKPTLALETEKPALAAPARVVAAARPDLRRQAAAERASRQNAAAVSAIDRRSLSQIDPRGFSAPSQVKADAGAASAQTGTTPTTAQPGPSSTAAETGRVVGSADGVDPFASGPGGRDLLSQAQQAAAAQVGEQASRAGDRRSAFRRYNDPFAEDYPSRLRGLRMREPQLFSDVSKFLVKTFGAAALGFALNASDEHYDFASPDFGPLVERWIEAHHGDLEQECKRNAAEMSEQVRKLLCETGK